GGGEGEGGWGVEEGGRGAPNAGGGGRAGRQRADAILATQVVTQRDVKKKTPRHFIDAAKQAGIYGQSMLLLGGPRVDHRLALELGFDAGFGPGTKPSDVANFIVHSLLKRAGKEPKELHYRGEPR